jgi:glycosyltransferase involved in cell wall biosynthesis
MSKVCVAICNYNHQSYLKESIKSILSQDYQNLDIAIIDDFSDDRDQVRDIVGSFSDPRIRFIGLEKNSGKWNALNVAFSTTDASICTAHDADDVSLSWRISSQITAMKETNTIHNLCGFKHCWNEKDVLEGYSLKKPESLKIIGPSDVSAAVAFGFQTSGINHYFTGDFETAGVSAMFIKQIWDIGFRFNPPGIGIRVLHSEDSDFNSRVTLSLRSTSILAESPYLYRRNTSTNREER